MKTLPFILLLFIPVAISTEVKSFPIEDETISKNSDFSTGAPPTETLQVESPLVSSDPSGDSSRDLLAQDSFPPEVILPPPLPHTDFRLVQNEGSWKAVPVPSYEDYEYWNHGRLNIPVATYEHARPIPSQDRGRFIYREELNDPFHQIHNHRPQTGSNVINPPRKTRPSFDFGGPPKPLPELQNHHPLNRPAYNPYIVDTHAFQQEKNVQGERSHQHSQFQPGIKQHHFVQHPSHNHGSKERPQREFSADLNDQHRFDQSDSLAKILAGATVLTHPRDYHDAPQEDTQHAPEQYHDYGENEYYDALYDEFLDVYYDSNLNESEQTNQNDNKNVNQTINSQSNFDQELQVTSPELLSPIETEEIGTITPSTTTISSSFSSSLDNDEDKDQHTQLQHHDIEETDSTEATFIHKPSTSRSTTPQIRLTPPSLKRDYQVSTTSNAPPLSLSEVVQKIGMSLPAFLSSLKDHDVTLSSFTTMLGGKHLEKDDLKKIRGDVGNLLALLREKDQKITSTTTSTTTKVSTSSESVSEKSNEKTGKVEPLSLSEILQKIGMKLQEFLANLKRHGSSLPEVTRLLKTTSFTDQDFKRINGDVGNFITLLRQKNEPKQASPTITKESTNSKDEIESTQPPILMTQSSSEPKRQNPLNIKFEVDLPTSPSVEPKGPPTPLIFGSRPAFDFKNRAPVKQNSTSQNNEKNKVTLKFDIISLMKDKNLTAEQILHDFKTIFNISLPEKEASGKRQKSKNLKVTKESNNDRINNRYLNRKREKSSAPRPYRPMSHEGGWGSAYNRGIVNNRLSSTTRPTYRPVYSPRPYSPSNSSVEATTKRDRTKLFDKRKYYENILKSKSKKPANPDEMDIATKSAIMAAGILGGVALSVFIAIFVVVKYKGYTRRRKKRNPISHTSGSSTSSSMPPLYAGRNSIYRNSYRAPNGFWNSLKRKFDPYSFSSPGTSM